MKRIVVWIAALWVVGSVSAQQSEAFPSYVEVTGVAEREVVPDEIYLSIVINERDSKGKISIDEQQSEMVALLKREGVKLDEQLKMIDLDSHYFKRGSALASANYELKLNSAVEVARIWRALDALGISQVSVDRVSHSKLEQIRAEVRCEAMRAARDNARSLADAIDQQIGKCFWIYDTSSPVRTSYGAMNLRSRAIAEEAFSFDAVVEEQGLEFQTIELQHRVQAKFVLE